MPAAKEWRISKSELARSMLGFAIELGVSRYLKASVDAMSIECDNVYEISGCTPLDKRAGISLGGTVSWMLPL